MNLIYDLVIATFFKLGMPLPIDVCETLLIEDGCFLGHKFHCRGCYALWGVGWNAVEFYDEQGALLKMVAVRRPLRSSTPAA